MFNRTQKCAHCGKEFPGNSNFCPFCGTPAKGSKTRCDNCGAENDAQARFCRQCGKELGKTQEPQPQVVENHWKRNADDFASRIEVKDLRGLLSKELIVEPGTRAMIIVDGKNTGIVDAGRYTLQSFAERMPILSSIVGTPISATAVLADVGDVEIDYEMADVYTKDPLKILVKFRVVVQLSDPVMFLVNLMKDERIYPVRSLRQNLYGEVFNAAQELIGKRSVTELSHNLDLKREIEVETEAHLNRTLERTGLRFVQVRTFDYSLQRYDKVTGIQEEYFLQISEAEAENKGRPRLFDQLKQKWLQELVEETAKTEVFEQRAALWDRMRRATLSDKMNEIKSGVDFDVFMDEVDRGKLLRAEERDNLKQQVLARAQDRDKLRGYLVAKADMEREFELKQMELAKRTDLTRAQTQSELDLERQRMQGQIELDSIRWENDVKRQRAQKDFEREQRKLDDAEQRERELTRQKDALEARLRTAQSDAEVRGIEREQERLDGEMGLALLDKMQTQKQVREHQAMLNRLEEQRMTLEIQMQELRTRQELDLQKSRAAHEQEIQRMETLAKMSTESLIAVSGAEQGRLLAELKRTETLKGFSEEQILAMAAEKSPQVAQAFVEKFKAMGGAEQQKQLTQMYEKMLEEQKTSSKSMQQVQEDNAKRLQQMFDKALESQRDMASAFAKGPTGGQPPIVVTSGGGQSTVIAPGTESGQVQICKKCHKSSPIGIKFCDNCGEAFY